MKLPDEVKRQATRYVEGFNAAEAERVSVLALKKQQQAEDAIAGDRVSHVRGGYGELMESIERQIDARHCEFFMQARVEEIAWSRGAVRAKAMGMQHGRHFLIEARAALITVPLSCLQRKTIAFDPPLDAKRNALAEMAMGEVVRVTLEFRSAFWSEQAPGLGFLFAADEQDFPVFWTAPDAKTPMITAWASGRNADRLIELSPAQIGERAIEALGRIFARSPEELRAALVSAHYHDWARDPYALGAYSYPLVGGLEAAAELAKPLEETLFFAGEHTESAGHHATVHGAMATGERAAGARLRRRSGVEWRYARSRQEICVGHSGRTAISYESSCQGLNTCAPVPATSRRFLVTR